MPGEPGSAASEFLLRFARVGHRAGYPTEELEERVLALAAALGLEGTEVSATPTIVEISLGTIPHQRSFTLRVRPPMLDLDAIARIDELVQDVVDGMLDADGALAALADVEAAPVDRPWPLVLGAYGLAGAAPTLVLGGGWSEATAAGVVGLIVGGIALPARRAARTEPMVAPVAAVAASFTAAVLVHAGLDASPDVVTLAALVTLLPGMTLTIGMRELATEHLQSGVANIANEIGQVAVADDAAAFVAAVTVGVCGSLAGSLLRRSSLVFIVPGVLMLVPGSAGFNRALQLLTDQTVSGVTAAFDTFITAMSMAYGLMVSTVILPPRFTTAIPARIRPAAPGGSRS